MVTEHEQERQNIQTRLDSLKTANERNRLGQFATPHELAVDMLSYAKKIFPTNIEISFLDPGFGTGSFYSALITVFPANQIVKATGFEIDAHYREPADGLWRDSILEIHGADFTQAHPPSQDLERYNLVICNPPYVRHHHILNEEKSRLQDETERIFGTRISGLAGLYCYFLALSHAWMTEGGIAGWLIPSEFMDVNYGKPVKSYLLNEVTLLRVHRFDPEEVQFKDALVSSAVVWFRKDKPPKDNCVEFTFGGNLEKPKMSRAIPTDILREEPKWTRFPVGAEREIDDGTRLGNFFVVRRGLATGDNDFFVLSREQIESLQLPLECFRPILPSPRYLKVDEVHADIHGAPLLNEQLFLLDCRLPPEVVRLRYPALWSYLESGIERGVAKRYLCRHRIPWYVQEDRPPSLFVCTYMGRGLAKRRTPFRFILNHSKATVTNTYLILYPRPFLEGALEKDPTLARRIWLTLNQIDSDKMLGEGRIYGGGLHKIEPKELGNVPAEMIGAVVREIPCHGTGQQELFGQSVPEV